jgi:hypothetical protein
MTAPPTALTGQVAATRLAVVTITCRRCGRVLSQSIPRVADPEEIETEKPCSPAFARWAACPEHPAGPPDNGPRYSPAACPLLWTVRLLDAPATGEPA